jgi:hypothetical protein
MWGDLSDERSDLNFLVVAAHRQRSLSRSECRRTHELYLIAFYREKERERDRKVGGW